MHMPKQVQNKTQIQTHIIKQKSMKMQTHRPVQMQMYIQGQTYEVNKGGKSKKTA